MSGALTGDDGGGPIVVVVTDRDLNVTGRGNVRRILALLARLKAVGCHVVLVTPAKLRQPRGTGLFDELVPVDGPMFVTGDVTAPDTSAFRRAVARVCAARPVRAVIVEYAWLAPCLEGLSGTLRVVDTHDVLHYRWLEFARRGLSPWVVCSRETERRLLADADVVMAIQEHDAAMLSDLVGGDTRVLTVPHTSVAGIGYRPSTGAGLLFVGSLHSGNLGIRDFLDHVWPAVRAARPDATLGIVGSICEQLEPRAGCQLVNFLEDRALAEAYDATAVVISPLVAGSGLKIKVVEALHHGRVVVATDCSVLGMPRPPVEPWVLANDWPGFATAILELLGDPERRHDLEQIGIGYARDEYSQERVEAILSTLLGTPAVAAVDAGREPLT